MLGGLAIAAAASPALADPPDLIVYDAHVLTVDKDFSTASAFAVAADGRFGTVGKDADVLATAGPATVKVDLHGLTVVPGFSDTHIHALKARSITMKGYVDIRDAQSVADIQHLIAERVKSLKPGDVIEASRGWWDYRLKEHRNPTKAELDKVAPDNPVILQVTHYAIVNSAALKAVGVTRDTPNPQGGIIVKDKAGEPTGILYDRAERIVQALIPRPTEAQAYEGIRAEFGELNSNGITSIREQIGSAADAVLLKTVLAKGDLTLRVDLCRDVDPLLPPDKLNKALDDLGPSGQAIDGMFRSDCISEADIDGASGLTELTREEYPGKPGYHGLQVVPQEKYNEFAVAVARHGWRVSVHAGGDAAIDEALTAFELAGAKGHRWTIEHAILMKPDQYERIKALGLVIDSQYAHVGEGGKKTLEGWNKQMADEAEHYKDWLAHGVEFASGSDGPISYTADPMFWIWGEVTRETGWGGSLAPDQGITREQALRAATAIGPRVTFEENVKGTIESGKYADFAVLSADIMTEPADAIRTTKILTTYLGGKPVFASLEKIGPVP